ncbi:unnamed protein product [Schistosoma haematobium]|nr:unnamed protein product [Schistosoma haematobium]
MMTKDHSCQPRAHLSLQVPIHVTKFGIQFKLLFKNVSEGFVRGIGRIIMDSKNLPSKFCYFRSELRMHPPETPLHVTQEAVRMLEAYLNISSLRRQNILNLTEDQMFTMMT